MNRSPEELEWVRFGGLVQKPADKAITALLDADWTEKETGELAKNANHFVGVFEYILNHDNLTTETARSAVRSVINYLENLMRAWKNWEQIAKKFQNGETEVNGDDFLTWSKTVAKVKEEKREEYEKLRVDVMEATEKKLYRRYLDKNRKINQFFKS